ncbi:MAG: hypothetical protein KDA17_06045, partial [Candidatus Saccharibacteria bacterium]|nr:hypothetical protein [Candidatus Saccharibacteria bacterium]
FTHSTTISTGTWTHLAYTATNSSFYSYVNGTASSQNTTAVTGFGTAVSKLTIGEYSALSTLYPFDGRIAEVGVYNGTVLSGAQISALASGDKPDTIGSCTHYYLPIDDASTWTDNVGSLDLTKSGTVTNDDADHPTMSGGGATDNLLADDVQSTSELTSPAIGQTHALNAADTQSTSETSTPAIGQVQALLASDTESASEVTNPAIQVVTPLLADDVQSTSEVSAPQIGQIHALTANPVESASQTGLPAVGQVHVLAANDIESTSQTDLPVIGQAHVLAANDVESASELSTPALTELIDVDALFAEDIQAASEVTTPSFGQTHGLAANDIQSISQLTYPTLGIVGLQQPGDFTLMRRRGRR